MLLLELLSFVFVFKKNLFSVGLYLCDLMCWQELSRAINNVMAMDADLSVDKIEINPSNVAATISATSQERIQIAPAKKPKPQTKPKPQKAADWDMWRQLQRRL